MIGKTAWFAAGVAAGVYGSVKARRAAYRMSGPGIVDQAAALGVGWRAFSADLRAGMREREDAVVRRLGVPPAATLDVGSGGDPAAAPRLGAPSAGEARGELHLVTAEDQLSQVLRSAPNRVVPPG